MLEDLKSAWRKVDAPDPPMPDDGGWRDITLVNMKLLEMLGLSQPAPVPEPKKRGRPRKEPAEGEAPRPKRPRGRPRKEKTEQSDQQSS